MKPLCVLLLLLAPFICCTQFSLVGKKGNRGFRISWTGEKSSLTQKGRHMYSRALRAGHTINGLHQSNKAFDHLSHGQFGSFGMREQVQDGQHSGQFNADTVGKIRYYSFKCFY